LRGFLVVAMMFLALPVLADCVSCGPGGECYAVSEGFSGNCSCNIRSQNGVAVCRPQGVCDPSDATSCEIGGGGGNGFPVYLISTKFVSDLGKVNPLLAGAVGAGIAEANTSRKGDRAEVKGTMGQEGKSYTYRVEVRVLPKGSALFTVHVQEDGTDHAQLYEGTLASAGRSGRFVRVGPTGKSPVFSWGASRPSR
jgi:hypothetical protein